MKEVDRFNIRVYGLLFHGGSVLVSDEMVQGRRITKFPGGGMMPGEGTLDCLRREIREETGLEVEVGAELPEVRYRDHKDRPKVVRYWAMEAVGGRFEPNDEVDVLRWLAPVAAAELLSYPHDVELLAHLPASGSVHRR